jgi:hypothetical protein
MTIIQTVHLPGSIVTRLIQLVQDEPYALWLDCREGHYLIPLHKDLVIAKQEAGLFVDDLLHQYQQGSRQQFVRFIEQNASSCLLVPSRYQS